MNRAMNGFVKSSFASRPVRIALAMNIAFVILAANVGLAAQKALLAKTPETRPARVVASKSPVKPFILSIDWTEPTAVAQTEPAPDCRDAAVASGEAARGQARIVCGKAL